MGIVMGQRRTVSRATMIGRDAATVLRRVPKHRGVVESRRMSQSQVIVWATLAVLLFWTVGAYNRLVGLRGALVQGFSTVDAQFRHRHELLLRLADTLELQLGDQVPVLQAFRAACAQAEAACSRARQRPSAAGLVTSLRLAEDILSEARKRLPADAGTDAELAALQAELNAGDSTFAFARRQFNDGVDAYNRAVRQFPTWLIAGLFRFRSAGTL
jgi:LemA protein